MYLSVLVLTACDIFSPGQDPPYPTTVAPLDSVTLHHYTNEYQALNNNRICTGLNEYGFCEYHVTSCPGRPLSVEITSENEMIERAQEFIARNHKFTGISFPGGLQVSTSYGIGPGSKHTEWNIIFRNQIYKGYEVLNTAFYVFLDHDGVYMIGGNWYPQITIPDQDNYTLDQAKESLYGHQITFWCWNQVEITVSESNIKPESRKVIVPFETDDRMELRVAWEIYIKGSPDSSIPIWVIYIDSMTGEILQEYMTVDC